MSPNDLVSSHLWLSPARCRALGLRRSHSVWDDAVQEGNIGMMKAAERFDAERGVRFEAYARPWVDNAIKLCFCAQQVVAEPIRRVKERVARGERAHPVTLTYAEGPHSDDWLRRNGGGNGNVHTIERRRAAEWAAEGGEEALADAIDQGRREAWLRARLEELPRHQHATLLAIARDIGVSELARREGLHRNTVRLRTDAGLEYLRDAARALGGVG